MKNTFVILILLSMLTGCYDEFRNDYPYTTVAFSTATGGLTKPGELGRTIVKDEGLKLDIGVYLAGVLENKEDRWVDFIIDPTLLSGTSYEMLPDDYYSLSNDSRITILKGEFVGKLTITMDSVKFLNDPKCLTYSYAIPFRLEETSSDSILTPQSTQILVVKYINHYEGYYNHSGSFTTFDAVGTQLNSGSINNVLQLSTISLDTVEANGTMNKTGDQYLMSLIVNANNSVNLKRIIPPDKSDYLVKGTSDASTSISDICITKAATAGLEDAEIDQVLVIGENAFDPETSTYDLNYKVTYKNETYYTNVSAKLVWRNRIRDGVNEWRR